MVNNSLAGILIKKSHFSIFKQFCHIACFHKNTRLILNFLTNSNLFGYELIGNYFFTLNIYFIFLAKFLCYNIISKVKILI